MLLNIWFWGLLIGALPVYWRVPARWRCGFLALLSAGYVASIAPESAMALVGWTLLFYGAGPYLKPNRPRRTWLLWGLVLAVLGFLAYYKYAPPLLQAASPVERDFIIPLGISYYTFKLIHYAIEVGRGGVPPHSFQHFACYMFLFPIFGAGPIERFDHFKNNLAEKWDGSEALQGAYRVIWGFVKKFLLAHLIYVKLFEGRLTPETLGNNLETISTLKIWAYVLGYYVYVYLDFSAYSDIAIGGSRLFGIRIAENFRFPVIAEHIREYWRRWHISLSQWCQFYVYMPLLGLYRKPLLSLYGTFLVMGLWHEGTLTRIGWGVYHATGVAIYSWWARYRKKRKWRLFEHKGFKPVAIAVTQLFVGGSMCFLILDPEHGLSGALRLLGRLVFL